MSPQGNSSSLSCDLLEQLKAQLPESLFATVSGTFAAYEKQLDTKSNELQYARLKIQLLESVFVYSGSKSMDRAARS